MTERVRTAALATALVLAAVVGACGDDHPSSGGATGSSTTSTSSSHAVASAFLVRAQDDWTPGHAIYPAAGTSPAEPSLDWVIDYEHGPADAPQLVRLSGHRIDVDGLAASLVGFSFHPAEVGGRQARVGRGSEPTGPSAVLLPLSEGYSAMALSYELTPPDLAAWAGALADASEAEWMSGTAKA